VDEPKIQLQPVSFQRVVSDGFVPLSSIGPNSGTKPGFQLLEERPAAFWKNPQKKQERKLSRKETAMVAARISGSRDPDRPEAMGDMPVAKSERPSQCQGVARAVVLMPGQAARGGGRRGTAVLTLGSGFLPLSASVRTRVISRLE
jgi:hypothetical protein